MAGIMAFPAGDPDDVLGALRAAGLRVTMPRQAVLTWLAGHPHSTADAIGAGVRERAGTVSLQAVYDVLAACTAAGLVRRIEPAGHSARFERRVGDNHHHLVCRSCGRTEDVDCVVGERPCLTPIDERGFTVDEAEVVFWGLCPACTAAPGAAAGARSHEEEWQ
jgi:Fur family transcriptional regulator, stress-responsive regulator